MKRVLLGIALLLVSLHEAGAWGSEGHSIVAEIAQRHLTSAAMAKVKEIRGGNNR